MTKLKKLIKENIKRGWEDEYLWATDLPAIRKFDEWAYEASVFRLLLSHSFAKSWLRIKLNPLHKSSTHSGEYFCVVCKRENKRWKTFLQQLILLKTVKEMVAYYWENK